METKFSAKPGNNKLCITCGKEFASFYNLKRHLERYRDHDVERVLGQQSADQQPALKRRRDSAIATTVSESSGTQQLTFVQEHPENCEEVEWFDRYERHKI